MLTTLPLAPDNGKFEIVGFGYDYLVIKVEGGHEHGQRNAFDLTTVLGRTNCIFVSSRQQKIASASNHIWVDEAHGLRAFPGAHHNSWCGTERFRSRYPETWAEARQALDRSRR